MLCACNVLKLQSNHVYPHVQINGHSHKLTILKYPHENNSHSATSSSECSTQTELLLHLCIWRQLMIPFKKNIWNYEAGELLATAVIIGISLIESGDESTKIYHDVP